MTGGGCLSESKMFIFFSSTILLYDLGLSLLIYLRSITVSVVEMVLEKYLARAGLQPK